MSCLSREPSCWALAWSYRLAWERFRLRPSSVQLGPLVALSVFDTLVSTDGEDEYTQVIVADIERERVAFREG